MRILFVVDGRSPIALNWIEYFLASEHQVHLASTFACTPDPRLASFQVVPVAFSKLKKGAVKGGGPSRGIWGGSALGWRTRARQWLGPLSLPAAARRLRLLVDEIRPELVHAMRIPYEGMLVMQSEPPVPFLVSVWGNDFTLHAPSTPWMRRLTRRTLQRADALHTDCRRDYRLVLEWGFDSGKPNTVLPGAGGVQLDLFYPPVEEPEEDARAWTVINPRGFRAYVRNDAFFQAIPAVLQVHPRACFLCPNMAGEPQAEQWVRELGIGENVRLLGPQTRRQMAELFRRSAVAVSPSTHDGTPNTLLEAMACGCFPLAGDLESLREWITPGDNGLLVDPTDPQALSQAIRSALAEPDLRRKATAINRRMVSEKAEYGAVMRLAENFYRQLVAK